MTAAPASTDVRQWLRDQGHDVPSRGAIRQDLWDEYNRAHEHPTVTGDVIASEDDYPAPDDTDITAADAPPPAGEKPEKPKPARERAPRKVTGKPSGKTRIWDRISGKGSGGKKPGPKAPRVSLADFAEETWEDLAWLAQPVPPLARMLALQAPYAGAVVDDQVKGTPLDYLLQPVARYSTTWRALNGLIGPPLVVGMICAQGTIDPETGQMDSRTAVLFSMLKFSLLQMVKVSDLKAEQIQQRAMATAERNQIVDTMIMGLFPELFPKAPQEQQEDPAPAAAAQDPFGTANGFQYPDPPQMDDTGARM